jgi:hypothetical protein
MFAETTLFEFGLRQLAARRPFEAVAQHDTVRNFDTDEICCPDAANLCKSGEPFLHREPHLLNNCNNTMFDIKNLKSVGAPYCSLELIYHFRG